MASAGVDALLLSVGADLPYLTGYEAMPLERVTMLVVPRDGERDARRPAARGAAGRRAARRVRRSAPWDETDDPIARIAGAGRCRRGAVAIGDQTWARFVLGLQDALPGCPVPHRDRGRSAPLRMVKDAAEIERLARRGARGRRGRGGDARATRSAAGPRPTSTASSPTGSSSTATSG